jgi:3'(2'), 5'-bisphosphate nucleotidase
MRGSLVTGAAMNRLADIAHAAGTAAMRFYGRPAVTEVKTDGSPVTEADRAAHEVIVTALAGFTPGVPVVSEEADAPAFDERRHWTRFWLVDPIDGTKEFIAANGEFTVNIALIENGEPVLGVVAAPALETLYAAGVGFGSWKHMGSAPSARVAAGPPSAGVTRVVESRSHPTPRLESFIATLGPVERIPMGSSLKFCLVAEGNADVYPRFGRTMEWDVAAGDCIFRNSGLDGRPRRSPLLYNQPSLSTPEFVIDGRAGHA